MAQLKMYWLDGTPIKHYDLPEGYSIVNYKSEEDKIGWLDCCRNGLVGDDAGVGAFDGCMFGRRGLDVYNDVFFIDYNGEHVGTVTAFVHAEDGMGDMHMVGIRTDFRGKGLSKYLTEIMLTHLAGKVKVIELTTDDWRKPAVKGYVNGGFLPVEYDTGMEERWQALIDELGIDSLQMLNDDATPYKMLYRHKD